MPRLKRVIVWEGDPNLLPNKNTKKNVVFPTTNKTFSPLIECYEDGLRAGDTYTITIPKGQYKVVLIKSTSRISSDTVWVSQTLHTRFRGGEPKYPRTSLWGDAKTVIFPGVYVMYNFGTDIIRVTLLDSTFNIDKYQTINSIQTPGIALYPITYLYIFAAIGYKRMVWNSDNTECLTHMGGAMQIPIILRKTPQGGLHHHKFSIENIRTILESNEDALILLAYPSQYDAAIIDGKFNTNFKEKTYEELGIQDLYEKYLEQSK